MEFAGRALIFGVFIVVALLIFVYSTFTRRGSGINQHPYMDPYGDAPGAWRELAHARPACVNPWSARAALIRRGRGAARTHTSRSPSRCRRAGTRR